MFIHITADHRKTDNGSRLSEGGRIQAQCRKKHGNEVIVGVLVFHFVIFRGVI